MANVLKVEQINTIQTLSERGWSHRRIARELGINRKTVAAYLSEGRDSKRAISTAGRQSLCVEFASVIEAKIEAGLEAQRIHQDLVSELGFTASYESVKRFVRKLRQSDPKRVWRMECEPGEEAQIDFGLGAPVLTDGRRKRTWVFRVVLSFSRKGYSEAVLRQDTESFIRCLENALRYFGGVPAILNPDNLKAAVLQADWHDPQLNPKIEAFCRHYGTTLMPSRPHRPQDKGKVESGIKYVKNNALKGRVFENLQEQNAFLRDWEKNIADRRTLSRYLKPDLLILDDMGIKQLPPRAGEHLFEIIMRRYENRSTIMTSNRPIEEWGKLIGDVPAATAILDRFLHHAEILNITGRSYRLKDRSAVSSDDDAGRSLPPPHPRLGDTKVKERKPQTADLTL